MAKYAIKPKKSEKPAQNKSQAAAKKKGGKKN